MDVGGREGLKKWTWEDERVRRSGRWRMRGFEEVDVGAREGLKKWTWEDERV